MFSLIIIKVRLLTVQSRESLLSYFFLTPGTPPGVLPEQLEDASPPLCSETAPQVSPQLVMASLFEK